MQAQGTDTAIRCLFTHPPGAIHSTSLTWSESSLSAHSCWKSNASCTCKQCESERATSAALCAHLTHWAPSKQKLEQIFQKLCFFVLCNRHWFNKDPGPDPRGTELGVTYLPSTISSDAGYADLPLPLLGAPVDVGALVKLGSRSLAKEDPDWSSCPPGTGPHVPFRRHRGRAAIHPSRSRD